jgi:Kef-type K+ transport system membrane component KefB
MPSFELNSTALLLLQIVVVVAASRLLGLGARRLGQPAVIAEIAAGIALGPSLLGWLWPEATAALFPRGSLPGLELLSQLGLVLFMFLVGLELDPKLLRGRTQASVVISHSSIIVPFALGLALGRWLYPTYAPAHVPLLAFMSFIGVALSVTAFPVLARILAEHSASTSSLGVMALACAAVDDVTAWCLLAFVVTVARSEGLVPAVWTCALALGFTGLMWGVARPLLRRLLARGEPGESHAAGVVPGILLLLLVSSAVTELIGIHALFGAFLLGVIVPREGGLTRTLTHKLETTAVVLLMPLFFAYSGLRTELQTLSGADQWLAVLAIVGCATIGKLGAATLAARCTGLGWREAGALGALMNTRGLVELVVLNVGVDLGVISPTIFSMLVIMALVTTAATSPLLRWLAPAHWLAQGQLPEPEAPRNGALHSVTVRQDSSLGPVIRSG